MTTTTIFADAISRSGLESSSGSWAGVMAGANLFSYTGRTDQFQGRYYTTLPTWWGYESPLQFATGVVPDNDTVSAAVLSMWLLSDFTDVDDTFEAYVFDWGADFTTADWQTNTQLSALALMATLASSGIGATGAYKTYTAAAGFPAAIVKTGNTRLLLASAGMRTNTDPGNNSSQLSWSSADEAGTTQDPKLVLTHTGVPPRPVIARQAVPRAAYI